MVAAFTLPRLEHAYLASYSHSISVSSTQAVASLQHLKMEVLCTLSAYRCQQKASSYQSFSKTALPLPLRCLPTRVIGRDRGKAHCLAREPQVFLTSWQPLDQGPIDALTLVIYTQIERSLSENAHSSFLRKQESRKIKPPTGCRLSPA